MKPTVKSLSGQNCCFSQYVLHLPYLFLSSPFQFLSPLASFSVVLKRKKKKEAHAVPFIQPLFLNEWTETARVQ